MTPEIPTAPPPPADRDQDALAHYASATRESARAGLGFAVLLLAQFLIVLDTTVVYVALPTMAGDLGLTPTGVPWVMDAYLIGLGGFLLVRGRLTEVLGQRRQFLAASVLFAAASLCCAVATGGPLLISGRSLQGLAAALATPAAMAILPDLFPSPVAHRRAVALFAGLGGIAGASGSLIGGVLLAAGRWPLVFLINLPLILLTLIGGRALLPAPPARSQHRPDITTATVATAGLVFVITALTRLAGATESAAGWTLAAAGTGLACLAVAVHRQRTGADPLIPRPVLHATGVPAGNLLSVLTGFSLFGGFYVVTMYLQQVRGLPPLSAGLLVVPLSVALFVGSRTALRMLDRRGPRSTVASAVTAQAAGLTAWALWLTAPDTRMAVYLVPGVVWAFGVGMGLLCGFAAATSAAPRPVAGRRRRPGEHQPAVRRHRRRHPSGPARRLRGHPGGRGPDRIRRGRRTDRHRPGRRWRAPFAEAHTVTVPVHCYRRNGWIRW